jgi:hypothetical protein
MQTPPDGHVDGTATWSRNTLERALRRQEGLQHLRAGTIHQVLLEAGSTSQQSRSGCPTGTAERVRKEGVVRVQDPHTEETKDLREQAYHHGERAGLVVLCQDEAGPSHALPQPGASGQLEGHAALQAHEDVRAGTATVVTLFRPATGERRAKGVLSAPTVVLHPWLQQELTPVLADIEKQQPSESWPPEEQRPFAAQWRTWLRPHERAETLPPFRIVRIWDNVAGHLTSDLVKGIAH